MVDKEDTKEDAEKSAERREKLKALRKKQQAQGGGKSQAVRAEGHKRQGPGGGEGGKDRPKLRKLMEQRKRQKEGGDSGPGGAGAKGGGKLRKFLAAGKKKKAGKGGFDLDKFPRLLDGGGRKKGGQGVTVTASSSLQEIKAERKQLQGRVDTLKKALEKTLGDLDKVEALERDAAGANAGSDK